MDHGACEPRVAACGTGGAGPWQAGARLARRRRTDGCLPEALVPETRAALDAGESLGTASAHVGSDLADGWQLFDDFNARNATTAYRELEWE